MICAIELMFSHEDVYDAVGTRATIPCHRSILKPVMWHYRNFEEETVYEVFEGLYLVNGYVNKCIVDKSTYDLTILKVKVADSGNYTCTEDEGFGDSHITKLFVTGM